MKAKFRRACGRCGEQIDPGTEIEKDDSIGKWRHVTCSATEDEVTSAEETDRGDSPWGEESESIGEHEHQDGFALMTVRRIEYFVCFTCEKRFLRHGRAIEPVMEMYDPRDFGAYNCGTTREPIPLCDSPADDPWAE